MRKLGWTGGLILSVALAVAPGPTRANPRTEEALAALDARIAGSPADVELLLRRAELHLRLGDHAAALADLALIDGVAPEEPRAALLRGMVFFRTGDDGRAEAELASFVEEHGGTPFAHALLGRLHERNDRLALAVASYDAALVVGHDLDVYLRRGRLLEAMGRLEEAAQGYEAGLAATGAVVLRVALVELELRRGRHARALELVDEGMRSAQNDGRWQLRRAEILEASGRLAEARAARLAALDRADQRLARRPTAAALRERGRALLALGRRDEALRDLTLARRRAPRLGEVASLIARARAQAERGER